MPRKSYVYDPKLGKMVEGQAASRAAPLHIIPDIAPFKSPVDGTVVSSRSKLREHNKRNRVINTLELDDTHFKEARRRVDLESRELHRERIEDMKRAYENPRRGARERYEG